MKKKAIVAAALSLALTPCICLFACTPADNNNENNSENSNKAAVTKLDSQVTGAKDTYTNIYNRAERNGGLFSTSPQKSASVARYMLADADESDEPASTPDEPTVKLPDTTELVSQLYETVKEGNNYNFPIKSALDTYVIDVFAYTQVAQEIINSEEKTALTKTYSVDYDINAKIYENLTTGFWSTKIPEKMSFAGFDEKSHKVNILFDAREPKNKENNVNSFEKVNSEMYYISNDDFGYAQFTYRYDSQGNHIGTGFDYFSMKDKAMLEINLVYGEISNVFYNGMIIYLNQSKRQTVKTSFEKIENAFTERTYALEQQNLALAKEAGIEGIETKTQDGKTVYVKNEDNNTYKVTFDYSVLKKMLG